MKLRNKKTGEIGEVGYLATSDGTIIVSNINDQDEWYEYESLAELNEEWEDYEEPKSTIKDVWFNSTLANGHFVEIDFINDEEAELAVRKLKAWKRLKDKNFHFLKYSALGCGEIEFSLDFEDMDDEGEIGELRHDLDLLFGGEE